MAFDLLLVLTFACGWALTYLGDYVNDRSTFEHNALLHAAGFNPITVGINHFPARIMSNSVWGVILFPLTMYFVASLFHYHWNGFSPGMKVTLGVLQFLAYGFVMGFGLLLGFEPILHEDHFKGVTRAALETGNLRVKEDFEGAVYDIQVHFWGFVIFIIGLGMIRLLECVTFCSDPFFKKSWNSRYNAYVTCQIIYAIINFVGAIVPVMLIWEVKENLIQYLVGLDTGVKPVYANLAFQKYVSDGWRVLFVVMPLVTWWLAPSRKPMICVTRGCDPKIKRGAGKPQKMYP